jgi:hypothetical protein
MFFALPSRSAAMNRSYSNARHAAGKGATAGLQAAH